LTLTLSAPYSRHRIFLLVADMQGTLSWRSDCGPVFASLTGQLRLADEGMIVASSLLSFVAITRARTLHPRLQMTIG